MVILATEDNPASPFYFFLNPTDGNYSVTGEGTGDKKVSDAAGDAIAKMTQQELAALLAATKNPNSEH